MGKAPQFHYGGVIPVLPTPFDSSEALDLESMARLIGFMKAVGVDGITVLGVLGEASVLTDRERDAVVRCAVEVADGLPVIVGTSRPGAAASIACGEAAAAAGAAAVMVSPPSVDGSPGEVVLDYFRAVAGGAPLPVIVQDHPASSRMHMPVPLLEAVVDGCPMVAGIKCEAVPTAPKLRRLKASASRPVPVLVGLGALYGYFDLEARADGFNTGFAFPEVLRAMWAAFGQGTPSLAFEIYRQYLPLIVYEQQPGPAVRKEVLRQRGLIAHSRVRAPARQADPSVVEVVASLLARVVPQGGLARPLRLDRAHAGS